MYVVHIHIQYICIYINRYNHMTYDIRCAQIYYIMNTICYDILHVAMYVYKCQTMLKSNAAEGRIVPASILETSRVTSRDVWKHTETSRDHLLAPCLSATLLFRLVKAKSYIHIYIYIYIYVYIQVSITYIYTYTRLSLYIYIYIYIYIHIHFCMLHAYVT